MLAARGGRRDAGASDGQPLSSFGLLDLREKVPQVCSHRLLGKPEGEGGSEQSALEAPQVADSDYVHPRTTVRGCGSNLPRASGLENVRIDNRSLDNTNLRPVVMQALPDISDGPWIALGDNSEVLASVVDLKMLYVDVGPQIGSPLGEVMRGLKNPLGRHRSFVDDVDFGQEPTLLPTSANLAPEEESATSRSAKRLPLAFHHRSPLA